LSASDGWQYQGRQGHGWFGNGTKPQEATAPRRRSFRPSFRWAGSRVVQAELAVPTAPFMPPVPLPIPNPDMGGPANERARRRWQYAAEEIRRGEYAAAIGHLFLGAPFPAEVDDPTPGPLSDSDGDARDLSILHSDSDERKDRPPPGSKPIDETEWSGDHDDIKRDIQAKPTSDVRISPA
jgi:hypothetical protein